MKTNMKNNKIKTLSYRMTILLAALLVLAGCAVDETTSPSGSGSGIVERVTYKPFASEHDDKFSLGDFDSPYLLRVEDYSFAINDSSILLNDVSNRVTKTDYQGGTYLGIAGFSFSDYTNFIKTNDTLTIKVNLVEANGTYTLSNETVMSGLVVTEATNLYTWQDLQGMKHNLAGGYQLMNSITFPNGGNEGLGAAGFEPVGNNIRVGGVDNFTGSFAGNGHGITNLFIERPTRDHTGIWGYVNDTDSVIKDFVLDHAGIKGDERVGAVVGTLNNGMVSNVGVVSSRNRSVSGNSQVGGLIGLNRGRVNAYVTGSVSGTMNVGGLVGSNVFDGTVMGYATGSVSGNTDVGGLVGRNQATVEGYATGRVSRAVSGSGNVGGLVGNNEGFNATGMATGYWDIGSTGQMNGFGANNVNVTFTGVGISSITNVVYDSTADTYTDNRGTADDDSDDVEVFNNMAFTNSFTLPGRSREWPKLNSVD